MPEYPRADEKFYKELTPMQKREFFTLWLKPILNGSRETPLPMSEFQKILSKNFGRNIGVAGIKRIWQEIINDYQPTIQFDSRSDSNQRVKHLQYQLAGRFDCNIVVVEDELQTTTGKAPYRLVEKALAEILHKHDGEELRIGLPSGRTGAEFAYQVSRHTASGIKELTFQAICGEIGSRDHFHDSNSNAQAAAVGTRAEAGLITPTPLLDLDVVKPLGRLNNLDRCIFGIGVFDRQHRMYKAAKRIDCAKDSRHQEVLAWQEHVPVHLIKYLKALVDEVDNDDFPSVGDLGNRFFALPRASKLIKNAVQKINEHSRAITPQQIAGVPESYIIAWSVSKGAMLQYLLDDAFELTVRPNLGCVFIDESAARALLAHWQR